MHIPPRLINNPLALLFLGDFSSIRLVASRVETIETMEASKSFSISCTSTKERSQVNSLIPILILVMILRILIRLRPGVRVSTLFARSNLNAHPVFQSAGGGHLQLKFSWRAPPSELLIGQLPLENPYPLIESRANRASGANLQQVCRARSQTCFVPRPLFKEA